MCVCDLMNSLELEKIAKKLKWKNFLGVFAADQLSQIPSKKCGMLIFNTDISEKRGEHWIAVCLTQKNIFYFDSLNHDFIFLSEIVNFLLRLKKNVFYNKINTQQNYSNTCGKQCAVFCDYMTGNMTKSRYCKFLNTYAPFNVEERDKLTILHFSIILNKLGSTHSTIVGS